MRSPTPARSRASIPRAYATAALNRPVSCLWRARPRFGLPSPRKGPPEPTMCVWIERLADSSQANRQPRRRHKHRRQPERRHKHRHLWPPPPRYACRRQRLRRLLPLRLRHPPPPQLQQRLVCRRRPWLPCLRLRRPRLPRRARLRFPPPLRRPPQLQPQGQGPVPSQASWSVAWRSPAPWSPAY